ncbi:MAG: penicillin-binding protein 2 [Verrucomicrobia bacterium]|nr:penicillin-binding protein 2 [Verrucomicrobiota bacterium]
MLKTYNKSTFSIEKRLLGVALFLLFLFTLLVIQFFRIQIVQHEKWDAHAHGQHTTVVKESFKRGVFYSNTSVKTGHPSPPQPLVIDVPKFHLFIDPKSIPEKYREEIAAHFQSFLKLNAEEQKKMRDQFEKPSHSRKVAMWLSGELKEGIESWWRPYAKKGKIPRNAIFFVKDYQRSYPYGKLLGQVIHTVRELRDEATDRLIPTGGLEYVFNEYLQGKPGKRLIYRSPRHAMDMGQVVDPPEDGADVYLTINHYLQTIAEEEIERQVKMTESKRGWALMMDPVTGEVLALAQYPFFSPKDYRDYFNSTKLLEETQIKAVTDPYEPGSTMKAVTCAIGLMANEEMKKRGKPPLFDPEEKMNVLPAHLPGRKKVLKDVNTHHFMNMKMALQKSSNVYVGKIVQRVIQELGDQWYRDTLHNVFGFGTKTGIELPGESCPSLPTPGKLHPNGKLEWSAPTPYSMAMGHNICVNSFQMLRVFAIFANGGYDVKPTLVRKISRKMPDGSEKILYQHSLGARKRLLDPEIVKKVVCGMRYTSMPGGSAAKGNIPGYTEAGKTGTTEKIIDGIYSKKDHISTYLGFAPIENPRFVLLIVIDEPPHKYIPGIGSNQFGGNCAAPAFARIGKRALEYLGVEPDDPYGYPVGDPKRDVKKMKWMAEVESLKALYDQWNR